MESGVGEDWPGRFLMEVRMTLTTEQCRYGPHE